MREAKIEAVLRREIKALGGECLKWVSPGCTGVPDRIVLLPGGRIIFVELKADWGKLHPAQTRRIARLKALGADVQVIKGMSNLVTFLDELRTEKPLK